MNDLVVASDPLRVIGKVVTPSKPIRNSYNYTEPVFV